MKPKKKTSVPSKRNTKKTTPKQQLFLVEKTIATTKEKTHNTIQDPLQIRELKHLPRSARNHSGRLFCLEKLEQCNLSPFSSPGRNSFSPRYRKTLSPYTKQDIDKVKFKAKSKPQQQKHHERRKVDLQKKEVKNKTRKTPEDLNSAYQNDFLKKMNEKKITEKSQQSDSVKNFKTCDLKIQIPRQKRQESYERSRQMKIKDLRRKIDEKYKRELPSLRSNELKFFCSVVLIQRLWKQQRIKRMISDFISPRSNPEHNITIDFRDSSFPHDITLTTEAQTSQLIRKYHHFSYEKKTSILKENHSAQLQTDNKMSLNELELSSEMSPQRQKKMLNFVECLRDITIFKPPKNKIKTKVNVFNLQESLSQKCLMQSFYEKIFKPSPSKMSNFQIFKSKKEEKSIERSIELINSIKSPQKNDVVIIEQRFETELQSKDQIDAKLPVLTAQMSVETDPFMPPQASNKQINSLKQLNLFAQGVIFNLLNQFCEEYHGFVSKTTLKRKKKNVLPGIRSSENSIRQYLTGLTQYMMQNYGGEVARRFTLISPLSFLKIHHEYDEDEEYFEQEDQDLNLPIVPQNLYYEYQQTYEEQHFVIPEQDRKYSNFLESLIKIHNLLLINCLSQSMEKTRMNRIILPWDNKMDVLRNKDQKFTQNSLKSIINNISNTISKSAFMRVGQFHKSIQNDPIQEERLLKSINMEYKSEGSDWSTQYEYLQLRMDLTKHIQEVILQEVIKDLMIFI